MFPLPYVTLHSLQSLTSTGGIKTVFTQIQTPFPQHFKVEMQNKKLFCYALGVHYKTRVL